MIRKLTVRHETISIADIPAGSSLRIAHLSDLHLWWGRRKLDGITAQLEQSQPDVIALTGDYADTPTGRTLIVSWLASLSQRYPVFWISGNHDHWWGGRTVRELAAIRTAHWVDSQPAMHMKQGVSYQFLSWEQHLHMPDQKQQSQEQAQRIRIVLLHDPAPVSTDTARGAHVLLAGHLHGGQIVLWKNSRGQLQPVGWLYAWCGDRWEIQDPNTNSNAAGTAANRSTLIVSRGLGDTLPIRFACPWEIVMVDLEGAA